MQTQEIIDKVIEVIQAAPEKAQDFIADPKGAIEAATGAGAGFDVNAVVQGVVKRAGELRLDFSHVDLSKLNVSQIDVSKLDLLALKSAADKTGIDVSKLDGEVVRKAAASLLGPLGSLFGR